MSGGVKRGAKSLTSRDWIFGSRPRRLVLSFVLRSKPTAGGWSKAALAREAGVHPKGGIDEHVRGLVALRLLRERDGRYWPIEPSPRLAVQLKRVLRELEELPEDQIEMLARKRAAS